MDNAKLLLHMKKNGLKADDVYRAIDRYLTRIPDGWDLLTAYTDGKEVIVMDDACLVDDDENHNCDFMGCGSLDHVLCRVDLSIEGE